MSACTFPECVRPARTKNRLAQPMCHIHKPVVVLGSWVPKSAKEDA